MSFWKKIQRAFQPDPRQARFHFELRPDREPLQVEMAGEAVKLNLDFNRELVHTLQTLAEEDQSTPEEVAFNLLLYGLDKRLETEGYQTSWKTLTPREREATALTCLGMTNPQIADQLGISLETVRDHVRNALSKFGLRRKSELREALRDWDFSLWQDP